MTTKALEGVHDALELLVEDLHALSDAARVRHSQLGAVSAQSLAMIARVEQEARILAGTLREVSSGEDFIAVRGGVRGQLVCLVTAACEFDAESADGGPLLSSEHGASRQMLRSVIAHLVGEFSFGFLPTEVGAAVRGEALVILNVICSLHFDDWKPLGSSTEVTA